MATSDEELLAERRNVTLMLRLVVDRLGDLVEGEVIDARRRSRIHFIDWELMSTSVRQMVKSTGAQS